MTVAKIGGAVVYKFDSEEVAQTLVDSITNEVLVGRKFIECGKNDALKVGFSPFYDNEYLLETNSTVAVQITTQSKKPHSAELKRKCAAQEAKYLEENDVEEVTKDVKEEIKHLITQEMLPTTPAGKEDTIALWITGDTLIVGVSSYKKGEDAVSMLRLAIGSLPVTPLEVNTDVAEKLTEMVAKDYYETTVLGDKVELLGEDGKSVITFAKGSVYEAATDKHLKDGATVSKLQLEYDGAVTFTTNTDLEVSGVKVAKDVLAGSKDAGALVVTMYELDKLSKELVEIFGGIKE